MFTDETLGKSGHGRPRPGGPTVSVFSDEEAITMSHTYCSSLFHCVFSTKERRKTITPEIQKRLWAYIGGVARRHDMKALAIGGVDDHVRVLLSLSASIPIAQAMRGIKSASSRLLHESCQMPLFEWQEGYGAFSIGSAQAEPTKRYITQQREHHQRRDFQAEFIAILGKHGIAYDPSHVWG